MNFLLLVSRELVELIHELVGDEPARALDPDEPGSRSAGEPGARVLVGVPPHRCH